MTAQRTTGAPGALQDISISRQRALNAGSSVKSENARLSIERDHNVAELVAHYRRLPETSSIHKFVEARLTNLLVDFPIDKRPTLVLLGRQGMGINACATSDGAIVVSPEMLSFVRYVEELDFILLHELTHLAHQHHQAHRDVSDSVVRSIGAQRVSEYDADLEAFTRLAHPARNSSPLGAIAALERFHQLAPSAWDVEHGTLVDRIMNLKMFTLFRDLSADGAIPGQSGSLSKPLRAMPAFIAREAEALPTGSRVQILLERPPLGRGYDEYRKNLLDAVNDSETPSLRWTIPKLLKDYEQQLDTATKLTSSTGIKWTLQSYQDVIRRAILQLSEHVSATGREHSLSPQGQSQLLGIELTLAGISAEDVKKCLVGPAQRKCLAAFRDISESLTTPEEVERFSELLSLVDGNAAYNHTSKLLSTSATAALVDNCAFDLDDDSIDIERCLTVVGNLADKISDITSPFDVDTLNLGASLQAQGFLVLASHLLDIESSQLDHAVAKINADTSSFLLDSFAVTRALNTVLASTSDPELSAKIEQFSQTRFKLLSLDVGQQQLLHIFGKIQTILPDVLDRSRADVALDSIQSLFQEAYQIAKFFPATVHASKASSIASLHTQAGLALSRRTFVERIFDQEVKDDARIMKSANFIEGSRLIILKVGFLQSLCQTYEEREYVASDIDDGLALFTNRFEDLVGLMNELRSERPEALIRRETLPSRQGNPHAELGLHDCIFSALHHELMESGLTPSPEYVLDRLSSFVTMTAISKPDCQDSNPRHVQIFALGENALRELYPEDRSSEQFLKHALVVSFFNPHQSSGRTIQREIILRLIDTIGSGTAARELFERLAPQRQWQNLETLEKLDETSVTVEEVRTVASLCREHFLEADQLASKAGEAVITDMILSQAVRWDSYEFLFTGLSTAQNDAKLSEMIAQRWWIAHEHVLMNPILLLNPPEGIAVELMRSELDTFIHELSKTKPATFDHVQLARHYETLNPENLVAHTIRTGLYGLGMGERLMTLRKLANDPSRGVLTSPERRVQVANGLLGLMLTSGDSDRLTELSSQAFRALFRAVPADDLGLALTPMLLDHFLRAPLTSASWRPFAEEKAEAFLEEAGWPDKPSWGPYRRKTYFAYRDALKQEVANHIEWALSGREPRTKQSFAQEVDSFMELCAIDLSDHHALSRRAAIPFILDFSRNLQTPGTRALQLLGGIVELPPEIEREFLQVYDARRGQSKQSALNTIDKTLPEYAEKLHTFKRIGGGALYSVFLVDLKNGGREVVRVVNPNPEYHTQRILHSMRAAQAQLERENPDFAIGAQVIDLVDEWITNELRDSTYEKDDKSFRKSWNHWTPSRTCPLSIYVPESYPTNTLLVRREEFIPGRNFTELENIRQEDPRLAKNAVALAVQNYVAQIKSYKLNFGDALVHSDISPGNLRLMEGGKVAILDRSMFLRFSLEDRLTLKGIMTAKTPKEQATALVRGLSTLQGHKVAAAEQAAIIALVTDALKTASTVESTLVKGLVAAQKSGLKVPLRFQLLVKNLNSLRVMAQKVGFKDFNEALTHDWK